jgi:plasmid stabilization system protein ParE
VKVCYRPDARAELLATVDWYEDRQSELGAAFLSEVGRAEALISAKPEAWPIWPGAGGVVRRFKLSRFPFCLAYQLAGDEVVVIAVAHQSRAPFYWGERTNR